MVSRNLDTGRNRASHHIAPACYQEHDVGAAADQVHKALIVIGVGDSKLHEVGVRRGIQQPQAAVLRWDRNLQHAFNGSGTAFNHSSHALFLNGGQASGKVPGADRILAHGFAVIQGLVVGIAQFPCSLRVCRPAHQKPVQSDGLHNLLKYGAAAQVHQTVKETPNHDIARQAAGIIPSDRLPDS